MASASGWRSEPLRQAAEWSGERHCQSAAGTVRRAGLRDRHSPVNDKVPFNTECLELPDSVQDINDLFHERGWTDGLPIIPPTEEAVREMLRFTDYAASDVLCQLPPRFAPATIELLAINCVMAGCRPEYFPVVLTAVKAATEEKYNLYGRQTTTNPAGHLILINGPIRKELDVNCGGQCFGPGWR